MFFFLKSSVEQSGTLIDDVIAAAALCIITGTDVTYGENRLLHWFLNDDRNVLLH